jgi:hypothetical protein
VTEEFLDYSAAQGNNLRDAGLKGGCKWCQRALEGVDLETLKKFAVDREDK